ncbi:uncharacterized protein JCM15063_003398 [Sporobolomyces koalae]|uniref:uncharacterized protein n=1 Tax=Sporobolomyces koalae TaxID=500713 RepID=UPI00317EAB2C
MDAQPATTGGGGDSQPQADKKRQYRAEKKAEQERRKAERKRIALETGVDPALLPEALRGGAVSNGHLVPKGFTAREWVDVPSENGSGNTKEGSRKVSIMTWNMLAQALVRRELFPGSDCLKGKDRIPPLMAEVLYYAPDVACLQEVDRLSDHLPHLTLTHSYTSFIGYRNKPHGLLIAHKNTVFDKVGECGLRLDEQSIDDDPQPESTSARAQDEHIDRPGDDEPPASESAEEERPPDAATPDSRASRRAAGLSRVTRNVALFVALKFKDRDDGIIVGTTHLFWHPKHVYERVRQTGILLREANKFRQESPNGAWKSWPFFFSGDFNTQPCELTYRLLLGSPLDPAQVAEFNHSACVHQSVDKFYDPTYEPPQPAVPEAKEGDGAQSEQEDPDKVIKNTRPATDDDGLADIEQIKQLYGYKEGGSGIRSAYGENYGLVKDERSKWYCSRAPEVQNGNDPEPKPTAAEQAERERGTWEERVARGDFEPIYTNFTPLWRCTLDYVFLLRPLPSIASPSIRFTSLLKLHDEETMGAGLPRKGIEPSDHVAIATVVELS